MTLGISEGEMGVKKTKELRIIGFLLVIVELYQTVVITDRLLNGVVLDTEVFGIIMRCILWVALLAVFKFKFWRIGVVFFICSNIVMYITIFAEVQSGVILILLAILSFLFLISAAYYFNKLKEVK